MPRFQPGIAIQQSVAPSTRTDTAHEESRVSAQPFRELVAVHAWQLQICDEHIDAIGLRRVVDMDQLTRFVRLMNSPRTT